MILVTGATGFVGSALIQRLCHDDSSRRLAVSVRKLQASIGLQVTQYVVADLDAATDWCASLMNVDAIVHCAARVHVMEDVATDPLAEFRRVNVQGTLNLARQAAAAGVKRFIFVSSVKVNGESTSGGHPFKADDVPAPLDAYGVSKHEAEQALRELASQTGMELVIVRPPLVYGPGVKANFAAMMQWLARGMPLPLGTVNNRRSLVALDNLVDLLVTCLRHPAAAGQTFLVSDGEDVSTTQLLRRMGVALGRPARLLPVPSSWLEWGATRIGKGDVARRLCGSLQVDITKTRDLLGWRPPLSLDEGLEKAAGGRA